MVVYRGHVKNGVVVPDGPTDLKEGELVIVRILGGEAAKKRPRKPAPRKRLRSAPVRAK
jgi:hypothetical protein